MDINALAMEHITASLDLSKFYSPWSVNVWLISVVGVFLLFTAMFLATKWVLKPPYMCYKFLTTFILLLPSSIFTAVGIINGTIYLGKILLTVFIFSLKVYVDIALIILEYFEQH
jgi:hypothetical protein